MARSSYERSREAEARARELEELAEEIREARASGEAEAAGWAWELGAAEEEGRRLKKELLAAESRAREQEEEAVEAARAQESMEKELLREEVALRAACANEAAEEELLEERAERAELQAQRLARARAASPVSAVRGGGAGAAGGADWPQARVRAKALQVDAMALRRSIAVDEADCASLRALLSSAPAQELLERTRRKAQIAEKAASVQRAADELRQLYGGLARRCAELEAAHAAETAAFAEQCARVSAQREATLEGLRSSIAAEHRTADILRAELREEANVERAAQEAELRLLEDAARSIGFAGGGGTQSELRLLRQELAESDRRAASLAALLMHGQAGLSSPRVVGLDLFAAG